MYDPNIRYNYPNVPELCWGDPTKTLAEQLLPQSHHESSWDYWVTAAINAEVAHTNKEGWQRGEGNARGIRLRNNNDPTPVTHNHRVALKSRTPQEEDELLLEMIDAGRKTTYNHWHDLADAFAEIEKFDLAVGMVACHPSFWEELDNNTASFQSARGNTVLWGADIRVYPELPRDKVFLLSHSGYSSSSFVGRRIVNSKGESGMILTFNGIMTVTVHPEERVNVVYDSDPVYTGTAKINVVYDTGTPYQMYTKTPTYTMDTDEIAKAFSYTTPQDWLVDAENLSTDSGPVNPTKKLDIEI